MVYPRQGCQDCVCTRCMDLLKPSQYTTSQSGCSAWDVWGIILNETLKGGVEGPMQLGPFLAAWR